MSKSNKSVVYFIQGPDRSTHPIKIGITTGRPHNRLRQIQTGSPVPLTIVHLEPGGREREAELHRRFRAHRLHGEWFAPSKQILNYIDHPEHAHLDLTRAARWAASPLVGAWRITTSLLMCLLFQRRARRYRNPAWAAAALGALAATAYFYLGDGPVFWAAVITLTLLTCTLIGAPER